MRKRHCRQRLGHQPTYIWHDAMSDLFCNGTRRMGDGAGGVSASGGGKCGGGGGSGKERGARATEMLGRWAYIGRSFAGRAHCGKTFTVARLRR